MPEIPKDKVNLRILLVNGSTHNFLLPPTITGGEIAQHIFNSWPTVWSEASFLKPEKPEVLRLIYRGRFLHETTTLAALSLPLGKTTVMHMIVRERIPEEPNTVWSEASFLKPEKPDVLRLIYRGRFLHETTTLAALSLPLGRTTVMHMIVQERIPEEPNTEPKHLHTKVTLHEDPEFLWDVMSIA